MRILHLIPSLAIGGAERQLSYLAPRLSRMGHDIHVGFLCEGPNLDRLKANAVQLHRIRSVNNYDPRILLQIVRLIRKLQPDIIQTWMLQMDVLGGVAALFTKSPWILREASSESAYPWTIRNLMRAWVAKASIGIISNSRGGDAFWQSKGINRRYIVPNGLPLEEMKQSLLVPLETFGINSAHKVILYVGRFENYKNIENLVRSLFSVLTASNAVALLCGEGPLLHNIRRRLIKSPQADRIHLVGSVPNVWGLMKQAHVCVSLSYFEGCPNTVMEAMGCGCPLVVSDIPAHRDLLDDTSAILVDPKQPTLIADAILHCLSKPQEARTRVQVAKKRIAQYSVASVASQYEQVYADILTLRRNALAPAS